MAIQLKPVHGAGFRVDRPLWFPLDGIAVPNPILQQDSAKFKSATITNVSNVVLTISVAVFDSFHFAASVNVFLNQPTKGVFLMHKVKVPTGSSIELDETYMDFLNLQTAAPTASPVIAVWVDEATTIEPGVYADVILRR